MPKKQEDNIVMNLIGQTIAGIVCHKYYHLNDVVIIQDIHDQSKVLTATSIGGKLISHTIENQEVEHVQITNDASLFLFHTKTKRYLVNDENQVIEDSDQWNDAYFEILSNRFYRQDKQGHWYDIEGFRMQEKVLLVGDVLTSLDTKKSKQALSFKNREIYISKNKQLIQIGKLVLDLNLEIVKYFGEKVTGLGHINISFEGKDILQEVRLGLKDNAFINEYTHEPFLFGDTKLTKYIGTYYYGKKRVVLFQANDITYGVEGGSDNFLTNHQKPLQIKHDSHVSFDNSELIKVNDGKIDFYFDLNRNKPFTFENLEYKNISNIETRYIRIGNSKVFNVSNPSDQFTVTESDGSIYQLDNNTVTPQRIDDVEGLNQHFGFATIDGKKKLFSKKNSNILKFGSDRLEVSEISYTPSDKLINAIDTNGNTMVLDLRHGLDNISMAETNGDKIAEVSGAIMPIGNKVLMNIHVEKLGGKEKRVVDLNEIPLPYFTLPEDLKQVSDQDTPSIFAGNHISEINYSDEINIEDKSFITANFRSFTGDIHDIILEKKSGNPIHLQGIGHRNELASTWVNSTIKYPIHLGENRMLGVKTIRENQKMSNLLFSVQKLTSWLPFYNNYLPILKQVLEIKIATENTWSYTLFELAEISKDKEYIVVEKRPPHRILVDKKSGEYKPRIVTRKLENIKQPLDLSALERFFYLDSSDLVEVE